jgi:hypothetical protein
MLPDFLVEETTIRESGQSAAFDLKNYSGQPLLITFGITHAVEKEIIELEIYDSEDGRSWAARPLVKFTPKSYCGVYELEMPHSNKRYIKAMWSVRRWSREDTPPFFRFFLSVNSARRRTLTAGAA